MWFAARLASEYILIFSSLMNFSFIFRHSIHLLFITSSFLILIGFRPGFRNTEYQPCGKPCSLCAISNSHSMNMRGAFKLFFHKDTLLLVFTLVCLWFTVSLVITQVAELEDLKVQSGEITNSQIVITRLKNKLLYKDTTREMRLFLNESLDYFVISGKDRFDNLDSLYVGDQVRIYTKDQVWGIFGFGHRTILHMERIADHKLFVDFNKRQTSNRNLWLITGIATLAFSLWYMSNIMRRMQ
jgi:hypothetical protein